MDFNELLQSEFYGNSLQDFCSFLILIVLGLLFRKTIARSISHMLYRVMNKKGTVSTQQFDELLTKPIGLLVILMILYIASSFIGFPENLDIANKDGFGVRTLFNKIYSFFILLAGTKILLGLVDYFGLILINRADATESKMDDMLIPFAKESGKILVYIIAALILLGNIFNIDVTALATGLGIGGLAIAMASKESLENLLGSFTIFLDKPFVVGDIVTSGGVTGQVEKVGFRSTRIRTFDKSVVTVPNKNMVSVELDNLGVRPVRRAKFMIGLTYDSSIDQIKSVVEDIQIMINKHPQTDQEGRVRFQEFGSSSLDIMVLFFVDSPSWEEFIDVKQDVNYKIMEIVQKHKCDFAFPSTTVYLQNEK